MKHYCTTCDTFAEPKAHTPGSIAVELLAWLLFLVPGILYSLWRLSARRKVCRACGSVHIVPMNTPVAQARLRRGE